MTTIVTRTTVGSNTGKGSPLTHTEVDTNFVNLNTAKLETAAIPLGTLQAPSISFLNDSDTGIFCPQGGNSLAIVTGGQYAITCSSTQAVGIKTANPQGALQVAGSTRIGANDATDAFLEIGEGATGNRNSYIDIVADTTYTDYGLRIIRNNTGANATSELKHRGTGALNFTTQEAAPIVFNTTNSPRLTITSGGLVGIGSSSPSAKLDVEAVNFAGGPAIGVRYNTSNARLGFNVANSNGFTYIGSNTNNKLSSDSATYDLTGHAASQLRLDAGQLIFNNAPSGTAGNDITFTNRLTITSAGLVGIGSTGPDAKLHIIGGASFTGGEANLAVTSSTTASVPATISSLNSDATLQIFAGGLGAGGSRGGQIDLKGGAAATDAGTILFRTGTGTGGTSQTEKARLDASGRLLVGTTTTTSAGELLRVKKASTGTDGAGINFEGSYSLDDDASQTVSIASSSLITITNENELQGALLFATYASATITIISDPSNIIATSDTDTKLCLFKSANTSNVTVKNRLGANKGILIGRLTT